MLSVCICNKKRTKEREREREKGKGKVEESGGRVKRTERENWRRVCCHVVGD